MLKTLPVKCCLLMLKTLRSEMLRNNVKNPTQLNAVY